MFCAIAGHCHGVINGRALDARPFAPARLVHADAFDPEDRPARGQRLWISGEVLASARGIQTRLDEDRASQ